MKKMIKHIAIIISILLICGCKTSTDSKSNVEIAWLSGSKLTYRYSSGVLVGGNWYNYFEVTEGDDDITFKVYVNGSKKQTETFTVEEELQYKIVISISVSGCAGSSNSSNAELKSSSVNNSKKLNVDCSSVSIGSISISEN